MTLRSDAAIQVRTVDTDAERRACFDVRVRVFVDEQGVSPEEELDALDDAATHYLLEVDGAIVGTARLLDYSDGMGKIGRVAVMREYRGLGLGRRIMETIIDDGLRRYTALVLDSQTQVIPFYERLGFVAHGPVFLDAGIDHRRMTLRVHRASTDGGASDQPG